MKVSELLPEGNANAIEIRVLRKWKPFQRDEISFLFVDKDNHAIEATTEYKNNSFIESNIRINDCYLLTNYVCDFSRQKSKVVPHEACIKFGKATSFKPIQRSEIPTQYFDFVPYDMLQTRFNDKNKLLTDFIGRFVGVADVPNRTNNTLIRIQVQHESGNHINVSLWDDVAHAFDREAALRGNEPVIVAFTSLRVTEYKEKLQLGSTSATASFVNPSIQQLPRLIKRFEKMPTTNIDSAVTTNDNPEKDSIPLFDAILKFCDGNTRETCICLATITDIELSDKKTWNYESCTRCTRRAYRNGGAITCVEHGVILTSTYRYRFKATIQDDSDSTTITFFDEAVTTLLGISCYDLVVTKENKNPSKLPTELQEAMNIPLLLKIERSKGNYGYNMNLAVNKVFTTSNSTLPTTSENNTLLKQTKKKPSTSTVQTLKKTQEPAKNDKQAKKKSKCT